MALDYRYKAIETLTPEQREEAIIQHEMRRLEVVREIEAVMTRYSKIVGKKSLRNRFFKVGKAANDWKK